MPEIRNYMNQRGAGIVIGFIENIMGTVTDFLHIKVAASPIEFEDGKMLFRRYADSLGIDLSFQSFDKELENITTQYGQPQGALILAYDKDVPVACVGVRKLYPGTAELKRMFVNPGYRGQQLGQKLLTLALEEAKRLGYRAIRLDTLKDMQSAIRLYKAFGFTEIEPYYANPLEGALYMEKQLTL